MLFDHIYTDSFLLECKYDVKHITVLQHFLHEQKTIHCCKKYATEMYVIRSFDVHNCFYTKYAQAIQLDVTNKYLYLISSELTF